jgi:hypothetical protein
MSGIEFEKSKIMKEIRKKYGVRFGFENVEPNIKCDDCPTLKRIIFDLIQQLAECRFKPSEPQGTRQSNKSYPETRSNKKLKIPKIADAA